MSRAASLNHDCVHIMKEAYYKIPNKPIKLHLVNYQNRCIRAILHASSSKLIGVCFRDSVIVRSENCIFMSHSTSLRIKKIHAHMGICLSDLRRWNLFSYLFVWFEHQLVSYFFILCHKREGCSDLPYQLPFIEWRITFDWFVWTIFQHSTSAIKSTIKSMKYACSHLAHTCNICFSPYRHSTHNIKTI